MSDKHVNKNDTVSQMRAMSLILSMLLCIAANAKTEFQEYTYTDEHGVVVSISNPMFEYELMYGYNPDYPDRCVASGLFSYEVVINDPTPVYIWGGTPVREEIGWYSTYPYENHPINKPFKVSRKTYSGYWIGFGYLTENGLRRLHDVQFKVDDFVSDEDYAKIYAGLDGIVDSDDILKCVVYDLSGFKVAEGITREEAGLHLSHGIYIVETTESNGNIKREKIYVR